jgi:hypothetical protein
MRLLERYLPTANGSRAGEGFRRETCSKESPESPDSTNRLNFNLAPDSALRENTVVGFSWGRCTRGTRYLKCRRTTV